MLVGEDGRLAVRFSGAFDVGECCCEEVGPWGSPSYKFAEGLFKELRLANDHMTPELTLRIKVDGPPIEECFYLDEHVETILG